jgi:ribose transport system ATP-binding protein
MNENDYAGGAATTATPAFSSLAPLLKVENLVKRFGAVQAVANVSFDCAAGEVHAIVGENGAGKSTVAKILAGAYTPTAGSVMLDGADFAPTTIRQARESGIVCAFQELALVPEWTVAENLILPSQAKGIRFSLKATLATAEETLAGLELEHIDPKAQLKSLLLADRQLIEIARSIMSTPRLLILDEASSALNPLGVEWLFRRIRELTAKSVGVVYVSHRLSEISEIADRGTVLRDGNSVGTFSRGSWTVNELVSQMAGRPADKQFPAIPTLLPASSTVISVRGLKSQGLDNVDLDLHPGEILGVGGLQGHGQTELLKALFGDSSATATSWSIAGQKVKRLTPMSAVRRGLGFVPEDRKTEGLALDMGVGENLLAPWMGQFRFGGSIRLRSESAWIQKVLTSLSVRTRGPLEAVGALSGGNQQKIVFGRWLNRNRKALILHDATRGIDVRAKQELYDAMVALAESGVGIIWFSSEVEELVHMCHRVVVLYKGAIVDELVGDALTAEAVVGSAVGAGKKASR